MYKRQSSLIAHGIASYFNVTNEFFAIENIPDFTILNSVKISALAILCALVSILFCVVLHSGEALYKKYLPNKYTRAVSYTHLMPALPLP